MIKFLVLTAGKIPMLVSCVVTQCGVVADTRVSEEQIGGSICLQNVGIFRQVHTPEDKHAHEYAIIHTNI
jgi:hypothetical protein